MSEETAREYVIYLSDGRKVPVKATSILEDEYGKGVTLKLGDRIVARFRDMDGYTVY